MIFASLYIIYQNVPFVSEKRSNVALKNHVFVRCSNRRKTILIKFDKIIYILENYSTVSNHRNLVKIVDRLKPPYIFFSIFLKVELRF